MKKRILVVLLIIPLFFDVFYACCNCDHEEAIPGITYSHCSIQVENIDNSGVVPIVNSNNTGNKNAFGLRVSIEFSENKCTLIPKNNFLNPSAYAFTCDCGGPIIDSYLENIRNLTINSMAPSNLGDNVSNNFRAFTKDNTFFTIDDYINSQYINNANQVTRDSIISFDLLMTDNIPDSSFDAQFEVNIELSDNRKLSTQSSLINLQ